MVLVCCSYLRFRVEIHHMKVKEKVVKIGHFGKEKAMYVFKVSKRTGL